MSTEERGRRPSYAQLLETNNLLQVCGDESYWLCVTRTVQESKLFPVSPYIMLSYLMAFYRYPTLLRKVEASMPAERIADRGRNMGIKIQNSAVGWALPCFYLLGREWLISMGLIRPQDAVEDVITVMDFWKRYMLSWHRNDGHMTNREYGHRAQILPERRVQVFHADMFECTPGDPLHEAAAAFLAAVSQYGFLVSCESRISLTNSGPYRLDSEREMIVRDFMDLGEGDFPWLDGVAANVPYNNLTVPMAAKRCHFGLVDDWGSFESTPDFTAEHMAGVGLYTSDTLSDGYVPVGMGSREELAATFASLTGTIKEATNRLWERFAGWTRDQMVDAGALTYFSICKDLAHVAGVYDPADWMLVDERADRFRPLLNDEFGNAVLGELVGSLTLPNQRLTPYAMMQHSDKPTRMFTPIPYSILSGDDYVPSCGVLRPGVTSLPEKSDRYRTTQGVMTLAEYNERARATVPPLCGDRYNFLCETWVKYNGATPMADELYRLEQAASRMLAGAGATVTQAAINDRRPAPG
ncbi:MAG: hypothetical protein JO157_12930 [Acetobacteraceae bacterium]|nr:hypothetical protein [Acetobacteraceae bacterium]